MSTRIGNNIEAKMVHYHWMKATEAVHSGLHLNREKLLNIVKSEIKVISQETKMSTSGIIELYLLHHYAT